MSDARNARAKRSGATRGVTRSRNRVAITYVPFGKARGVQELLGAGDGIRTRDQELGKLLLYQLSYARLPP
jgi:hypothetical protein